MSTFNPIDAGLIAVLVFSVLLGLLRGMLMEVLSLLGWLASWYAAQYWGAEMAAHIPLGASGSDFNRLAGFVTTFVAVLLVWSLMSWLLQKLMRASPMSAGDRALGGLFGFVRGLVVVTIIVMVVSLTPFAKAQVWQDSIGTRWFRAAIAILKPVLPGDWAQRVASAISIAR
jgi:membrane protein required for colicin V production